MIQFILYTMLLVCSYSFHIEAATPKSHAAFPFEDIPLDAFIHFLSVRDIVSLSATDKAMQRRVSNEYTEPEAGRFITKVAREIERYTSEENPHEEIKESTKKPESEPSLKLLYRVQQIHRMLLQNSSHFKATTSTLIRKVNESRDVWLNRIEGMLLEREALTALYNNTNGEYWNHNTDWNTDTNICNWYGVVCRKGSVTQLILGNNKLTGTIPSEIGKLRNLIFLRLRSNQLTGTIPTEIGRLTNLKGLNLRDSNLSGSIPTEISLLTNLKGLYLSNNNLSGSIPNEIGRLSNLERLSLHSNKLTGSIPKEIGELTKLERLFLENNDLSGPIPTEIGKLTNIEDLHLQNNQLSGPIPKEIGQLKKLESLNLYDNKLTGPIPSEIGQLPKLEYLDLGVNQLTGSIPTEIRLLTNLEYLNLYHNELTGPIPLIW